MSEPAESSATATVVHLDMRYEPPKSASGTRGRVTIFEKGTPTLLHSDKVDIHDAQDRDRLITRLEATFPNHDPDDIAALVHQVMATSDTLQSPKNGKRIVVADAGEPAVNFAEGPVAAAGNGRPWLARDWQNGQRLAYHFRNRLKYDARSKLWREWDGKRWKADENGTAIFAYAAQTARLIYDEAKACDEEHRHLAADLAKHAAKSMDRKALANMIEMASKQKTITPAPSAWNADRYLFNCMNGTIHLRDCELHPHDPADLITCLSPVPYDPAATSTLLDSALTDWIGDPEIIAFIRRAAGVCLSGDATDEKLFFVHGPTNSGKSTFMEMMKMVLADYARTANFETFLKKQHTNGAAASGDIARLAGARFVSSSETDDGKELAEGVVKNMTGGEKITARFMYCPEFEFLPEFKLWLVANHAPHVDPDDSAIWRRIVRVPFDNTIPEAKRDVNVKRQLTDPSISGPAILAWLMVGFTEWQEFGLSIPDAIKNATEEMREEMDTTVEFLDTCLNFGPSFTSSYNDIKQRYDRWAQERCIPQNRRLGDRKLANKLKGRGARNERDGNGLRYWNRVGVRP